MNTVLLVGRHGEDHPGGGLFVIEGLKIVIAETDDGPSRGMLGGCGMQGERRCPRVELAPFRRLKLQGQPYGVALKSDRPVHIGDKLDRVGQTQAHDRSSIA